MPLTSFEWLRSQRETRLEALARGAAHVTFGDITSRLDGLDGYGWLWNLLQEWPLRWMPRDSSPFFAQDREFRVPMRWPVAMVWPFSDPLAVVKFGGA